VSLTSDILNKLRRAYRNEQGTHFSAEELRHMARLGMLHIMAKAEADEIVAGLGDRSDTTDQPSQVSTPTSAGLPRAFSVKTLAARWSCSEGLVRKLIATGELKSFKYGNLIRIPAEAVEVRERVS
jgi:excisionase family DNA binding protein